jgi:hypothetical protein
MSTRRAPRVLLGLATLTLTVAFATGCHPQDARIAVDPSRTYQTLSGWEVTSWVMDQNEPAFANNADAFYDVAVQSGVNRLRLEVRSGAENTNREWQKYVSGQIDEEAWKPSRYPTTNDNDDPDTINWAGFNFAELDYRIEQNVLPMRRRLEAQGETLIVNLCYVAFINQVQGAAYAHRDPEEYGEFVLATYLHMQKKYGFTPDVWEVILEPDLTGAWDGTQIGKAIVAAATRLKAHGFTPRFVAPSVENMGNGPAYIDQIAAVPGAMSYVEAFSYHRYNGASPENLRQIAERAKRYGKQTAMLEWWFKNATPQVLYEDLTEGMNSAWQGQILRDVAALDESDPKRPVFGLGEEARLKAQFFRYARLGAKRIEAASSSGRFRTVAFLNPGRGVAVVTIADGKGRVYITGLPAGRYRVSFATEQATTEIGDERSVAAGEALEATLPGEGVATVFDARLSWPLKPVP